jgi:hypothetical protein
MDPGSIGVLAGLGILSVVGATVYIYDKCYTSSHTVISTPLLAKQRSFKVRNLFSHVEF